LELLYQQALKAHGENLVLRETLSGMQAQALQASKEKISQNQLLAEAMRTLWDTASTHERCPSLSSRGEIKVNTK
jgi:aminoglycoside phosphotransferase